MHAAYLAMTGNDAKALRLIERHIGDARDDSDPRREFVFFRYAWLAMELIRNAKEGETAHAGIIQNDFGRWRLSPGRPGQDLRRAGKRTCTHLRQKERNDWHSQLVKSMPKWKKFAFGT